MMQPNRPPWALILVLAVIPACLSGCGGDDPAEPLRPSQLERVDGDQQRGAAGQMLTEQLSVRVLDQNGDALSGAPVEFSVTGGGGSVTPATTTSNSSGLARTSWTLGTGTGTQRAEARVAGVSSPVAFTAQATAGPPTTMEKLSGDEQSGRTGTVLSQELRVRVTDAYGNPVSGVTVEWTAEGGTVDPATSSSDADGEAATTWALAATAGEQTVSATVQGSTEPAATFMAEATGGEPAGLQKTGGDAQTGTVGAELPQPLTVTVVDENGAPVAGIPVQWSASAGTLAPSSEMSDAGGAVRAIWTLDVTPGMYSATASLSGGWSVEFTATGEAGPPAWIEPAGAADQIAVAGLALPEPARFRVLDIYGNPVAGASVAFEVTEGAATLDDLTAVTDGSGTAAVGVSVGEANPLNSTLQLTAAVGARSAELSFSVRRQVLLYVRWREPQVLRHSATEREITSQLIAYDWLDQTEMLLSGEGEFAYYGDLSPDGSTVAYSLDDPRMGTYVLNVVDLGTGERKWTGSSTREYFAPRFSPDGETIVFNSEDAANSGNPHYVRTLNVRTMERNEHIPSDLLGGFPAWLDEQTLIMSVWRNGSYDLRLWPLEADDPRWITATPATSEYQVEPTPFGTFLATCESNADFEDDVCEIGPDGQLERLLAAETDVDETSPTLSPDGQTVAFERWAGTDADIYFVPRAGGTPQRLPSNTEWDELYPRFGVLGWDGDGMNTLQPVDAVRPRPLPSSSRPEATPQSNAVERPRPTRPDRQPRRPPVQR